MILTKWGYTLTDATSLPDMVTEDEFNIATAGKYNGDVRIESEIKAAQDRIRDYVGWHLIGNYSCEFSGAVIDKVVSLVGTDIIVQLPARYVTAVSKITVGDTEESNYYLQTGGILRIFDAVPHISARWTPIVIDYNAGIDGAMADAINDIVIHRVTHALANSYGIQSESSGGVSVTYSANWSNNARATALADDNKEVLEPYRLKGVF